MLTRFIINIAIINKKAKIEDNYENLEETKSFYFKLI